MQFLCWTGYKQDIDITARMGDGQGGGGNVKLDEQEGRTQQDGKRIETNRIVHLRQLHIDYEQMGEMRR